MGHKRDRQSPECVFMYKMYYLYGGELAVQKGRTPSMATDSATGMEKRHANVHVEENVFDGRRKNKQYDLNDREIAFIYVIKKN